MTALLGLDDGTTGVKGVAIDEDGRVLATASAEYPLSTPQPGWAGQDPELWWGGSQNGVPQRPPRALRTDARARRPRQRRGGAAPGDSVERPADRGGVRRDRGARRPRAAD